MEPYLFEAVIAVLWLEQGYQVALTPRGNDRGADVVARSENHNLLL
jgi:HJR/Mrr/RecB family endonuclease